MSWRENRGHDRGGYSRGGRGRGGNYRGGGYRGGYQGRSFNKRPQSHRFYDGKRTKFEVSNRLKEVDIGITEFMSDHEHFSGIVKERFGDFHVHEISLDGEIAKLTTQEIPESVAIINYNILDVAVINKLEANLEILNNPDTESNLIEFDVTDLTKEQRRVVHQIVKQKPLINSDTIDIDNKKIMMLSKHDSSKQKTSGYQYTRDNRVDWSQRGGLYCHFLFHKVNLDTMDALNQLALNLRLKPNMLSYAGTKDRRAYTTQWVSVKRVEPKKILEAGKRVCGAYVGNFKYAKDTLKLGMLSGNRFTIALRNVSATDDEINKAMTNLRDNGFINYYGLQRFGSVAAIPTHDIGKALLQGNWNEAIDLILKPRDGEYKDMTEAREIYAKTKDAGAALKRIYRMDKIEAKLLRGIQVSGLKNPQGALDFIPRNTRLMYIHAYQSYVWNHVVSRRIREFGRKPIVGDLVYEKPESKNDTETLDYLHGNDGEDGKTENLDRKKGDDPQKESIDTEGDVSTKVGNEMVSENANSDEHMEVTEVAAEIETKVQLASGDETSVAEKSKEADEKKANDEEANLFPLPAVKVLTEEDLENYSLADVVMPQPGWRVVYPPYAKAWYEEYLSNDGLDADLKNKNKKYSLGGGYRQILQLPEGLTWKTMNYAQINDELIQCDIDELRGNAGPKNNPDGKYKALIMEMSLKSSTYATMALREILKHDTSAETQAAQSAAHHAQDEADDGKIDDAEQNQDKVAVVDEVKRVSEEVETKMEIVDKNEIAQSPMEAEPIETQAANESKE